MEEGKGIWKITSGKGNRIYINCNDESKIMHPQELCKLNGLGMYGYENLKDLAVAILRFEKTIQESESILNQVMRWIEKIAEMEVFYGNWSRVINHPCKTPFYIKRNNKLKELKTK
jgi:hypothetical protein